MADMNKGELISFLRDEVEEAMIGREWLKDQEERARMEGRIVAYRRVFEKIIDDDAKAEERWNQMFGFEPSPLLEKVRCRQCGKVQYVLRDGSLKYITRPVFSLLTHFFEYVEAEMVSCEHCKQEEEVTR